MGLFNLILQEKRREIYVFLFISTIFSLLIVENSIQIGAVRSQNVLLNFFTAPFIPYPTHNLGYINKIIPFSFLYPRFMLKYR